MRRKLTLGIISCCFWAKNISAKCNEIETYYDIRESKEFRYLNSYDWKLKGKAIKISKYIYKQKLVNCRLKLPN